MTTNYKLGTPLCKGKDNRFHFAPYQRSKSVPPSNPKKKRVEAPRERDFQANTLDSFGRKVVDHKQYWSDMRYLFMKLDSMEKAIQHLDLVQYHLASSVTEIKHEINSMHTTLILSQPASITEQWYFNKEVEPFPLYSKSGTNFFM